MVSNYGPKNYKADGGNKWIVSGDLDIQGDGQITQDGEPVDLGGGGDADPVEWEKVQNKPSTFPPGDDYYNKTEVDNLIAGLQSQIDDIGNGDDGEEG